MNSIYTAEYQQLLDVLKQARKDRRITQLALAEALGRPQSFVHKYENGDRRLDVVEFVRIAQLLGLDPAAEIASICGRVKVLPESRKYGYGDAI